jgi:uncharacterized membrane protein
MLFVLVLVTLASGGAVLLGWMGLVGRLPRNHFAGIRTRYTLASDENWERAHRGAAPLLIFGGVAGLMIGLAFLPFAAAGSVSASATVVVSVVIAIIMVASAVAGWVVGTHSARGAPPSQPA